MTVLSGEQRKLLLDVVVQARDVVEGACTQRIAALGVAADRAPAVLGEADRAVRVGLRARARQLGSVEALVAEAGFEHWHRMLFARFLADNGLLVHPQFQVPVTMDEIAELAAETVEPDIWEVAAGFAAHMLPGIFRQDDPILAMRLPVETRQELERLLDRVPVEVITAEDALGWVYQYWQTKRKDEVNRSERKIGGADLAPVTQLFTENYMVRFLLENSLGAWWAARHPESPLLADWGYQRRNDDGSLAVGRFDGWPDRVAEVTVMDPCCGSGHFLTAAFGMLWRMRAEEEGLDPAPAQDAVIAENLFGLELDPRCTQIAAFALALEAWKTGGYRTLPLPNIACSGIPARAPLADWLALAGGDPLVQAALTRLHALFANADTLGSLIDPVHAAEQAGLESVDWTDVAPLVQQALTAEAGKHGNDPATAVFGEAAAGIARAADYLSRTYTLACTNPPYLGSGRQTAVLADYLARAFPQEKADLAIALQSRLACSSSATALVVPQNWMFLGAYRRYRESLLRGRRFRLGAQLGTSAFEAISGEVVSAALCIHVQAGHATEFLLLDCSREVSPPAKAAALRHKLLIQVPYSRWLAIPDLRVTAPTDGEARPLSGWAFSTQGLITGDNSWLLRYFWEVNDDQAWRNVIVPPKSDEDTYAGREFLLRWDDAWLSVGAIAPIARLQGMSAWGRPGIAVGRIAPFRCTLTGGEPVIDKAAALVPLEASDISAVWSFLASADYRDEVRRLDTALAVASGTLVKVPFDADRWRSTAAERYPDGLPEPFSDDPTQWLFKGVVAGSENPLQVAVARLLGFRWPDQEPDALDERADADGIVCIPALGGETTAEERLRTLLATAYGEAWTPQLLDGLLVEAGARPGTRLEKWLRDGLFKDHCKVFANRPFIWHIWDGRPDGFSALVNYHKLDRKRLESLTYNYLGSWWVARLNDEVSREVPGGEARLAAALELKAKLKLILQGEPPYDIYVRWKSLAEQPLGWEPDLDDGVRLNIRPFMTAGVLRTKPNIKWEKDRGKNPDGTERLNDLHYTLAEKRAARGGAE